MGIVMNITISIEKSFFDGGSCYNSLLHVCLKRIIKYDYTTNGICTIYPTMCTNHINTLIDKGTVYATSGLNAKTPGLPLSFLSLVN